MDFFNVFLNSVIVVVLYLCTYYFVDRRQIRKDENAKNTADILLLYTYRECLDTLSLISNQEWTRRNIIPGLDGNKAIKENPAIKDVQDSPFRTRGEILELSKNGYVEKDALDRYFQIQIEYRNIVALKIVFYDLDAPQTVDQKALYMEIKQRRENLNDLLNHEIERLE